MHPKAESDPFPALFSRLYPRIVRLVQRIVGDRDTAEDLTQEAFMRVMHREERHPGYLFRTAQNLAFDHLRAQRVRQRYAEEQWQADAEESPSLEDEAAHSEALQRQLATLATLPERARRVFLLNRLDGLTYADIAQQLGVSVSTVEKDMIRVLKACSATRDES